MSSPSRTGSSAGGRVLRWAVALVASCGAAAAESDRVRVGPFSIDRTEVTIERFRQAAGPARVVTAAEREGGGFEFALGWTRRPGWSVDAPFGRPPVSGAEPAVHVTWREASDHCAGRGGRLPTLAEWRAAAFTEEREDPSDGFERGRVYRYPVGDDPSGMNTSTRDPWPRHAAAGATKRGVNGLHDMGGNVWEWLADRRGDEALTAGGSWWYGPDKAQAEAGQWKPAAFYAVYVGFRCVYDPG